MDEALGPEHAPGLAAGVEHLDALIEGSSCELGFGKQMVVQEARLEGLRVARDEFKKLLAAARSMGGAHD